MGALITVIVAVYQQWARYRREAFAARIEEFCKLIGESSDYAVEYWLENKPAKDSKKWSETSAAKLAVMEAKLNGFQQKVALCPRLIEDHLKAGDRDDLTNLLADFFDALTGGTFGETARQRDEHRSKLVYSNGTSLVSFLRRLTPRHSRLSILVWVMVVGLLAFLILHPAIKSTPTDWVKL